MTVTVRVGETGQDDMILFVREMTDSLGARAGVEFCGVSCITEGIHMLKQEGTLFELDHLDKAKPAKIDPLKMYRDELEILGN